jgi:RNase P subunit RPR2
LETNSKIQKELKAKFRKGRSKKSFSFSRKEERRKIAEAHISKLMELAQSESSIHQDLAKRYADIAWSISTRFNVRLREQRRFFCRYCKIFALRGDMRYRFSKKRRGLNITCLKCGRTYHRLL